MHYDLVLLCTYLEFTIFSLFQFNDKLYLFDEACFAAQDLRKVPFRVTFLWSAGRSWIGPAHRTKGKATVGKAADVNLFPCSFSIAINTEELYSK